MAKFTGDCTVIFEDASYEVAQARLLEFFRSLPEVKVQRISLVEWEEVPAPPVALPAALDEFGAP